MSFSFFRASLVALRDEWEKVCSMCGMSVSLREWRALPLVGYQEDGRGGFLELRNHHCLTTLSCEVTGDVSALAAARRKKR